MRWFGLRDDRKGRIKDLLSGRADLVGVMAADNRLFEEVLHRYHYRSAIARSPGAVR